MQKRKTTRAWRILQKIQTIERDATTSFLKTGSVPKEKLLNRCLKYIEEIQNLPHRTARSKERVLKQAWNIYLKLTELAYPTYAPEDSATLSVVWGPLLALGALLRSSLGETSIGSLNGPRRLVL